jgi:RNA polymerase sigma-70 factor (ECF subfamily)
LDLKQLINDCKNKDRKAQEQLYQLYAKKLFAVCLKYSRNYSEAQDHLQDGFLIVFQKIEQFSFKGSFEGWLKRIIINYVLQQYRNQPFLSLVDENVEEICEIELDDESISLDYLLTIIQELPDRYRLVFNLYVLDEFSHQEIAEMLSINIGTSKSNLARARMILKNKIEQQKTEVNKIFPSAK